MTELDEIVLVTKMAWALKHIADPFHLDDPLERQLSYISHAGIDIADYQLGLAARLDRKAWDSEKRRRALAQTKVLA